MTASAVQTFPELPPDTPGFTAAAAGVHCTPVLKLPRHIPPRNARAGDIEDGCDKQPVTQFTRPDLCLIATSLGSISAQTAPLKSKPMPSAVPPMS
jgi:hypothetical protein